MTRPTAIYRPIEREVLLIDGDGGSIPVSTDRAAALARALARYHMRGVADPRAKEPIACSSDLCDEMIFVRHEDALHLARDIDHALAVRTIAAGLLDDAQCR